ncbi:hypothetical protein HanXRQr2_Chr14g0667931 [Helianthus annuus]|uniref:Uncharacterized protein n=1 Tax=Helianthus annuus TaxID=4232 RepID=A0A9K3H8P1_HELAN|nr:hypothetical protein HanXRQr2_Chr14g0667931 [Helianthus annuus]KAJ0487628.1 hypothetical protein HanHA89_Chr14g0592431 [Helianthus annuus]
MWMLQVVIFLIGVGELLFCNFPILNKKDMPQATYLRMPFFLLYTEEKRIRSDCFLKPINSTKSTAALFTSPITTMPGGDSITTTDTYSAAAEDESKKANVFRNTQAVS